MSDTREHRLRFDECELDLASRQLWRDGELVSLQPRVYDLLAYLIAERRRAVDKEAIQDAVWGGVIVTETALTRAIMKARRAVGDNADKQAVIRTVHGHGYQFVAPVQDDTASEPPTPASDAIPAPDARSSTDPGAASATSMPASKLRWFVAGIVAVVLIGMALLWRPSPEVNGLRIAVMPVHNATGNKEYEWARLGLMGFANDLFKNSTDLKIVAAADVVGLVDDNGWSGQYDERRTGDAVNRMQRAYGASHVLMSELEDNAGNLRLNYWLADTRGNTSTGTMVSEQTTELVEGLVRSITTAVGHRRHLQTQFPLGTDDPFINEAYARAMSFSLEGRCADALPLFEVVKAKGGTVSRAHFEWANCSRILGNWKEAESAFTDLLKQLESTKPDGLRAEILNRLGTLYHHTGRRDDALIAYNLGFDEAVKANDKVTQGQSLTSLAILAKDRSDYAGARQLIARATVAYRESGREILPGQLYSTLANTAMSEGKLSQAQEHLEQALSNYRELGDRRNEAKMLNNFGYLRRLQGRYEDAEPYHLKSLAIRREIGDKVGQGRILGMLSTLYAQAGRFDEAKTSAVDAVNIAREANDQLFLATGLAQVASAERGLGNLDAAQDAYEEALLRFQNIEDHKRTAQVQLRLAKIEMDKEKIAAAESRIDNVLNEAMEKQMHEPAIEAMQYAGDIAIMQGKPDTAIAWFARALTMIDNTGFTANKEQISIDLTQLYLDQNNTSDAEPLLGYIMVQDPTPASLKVQARFAYVKKDYERAVNLMSSAKDLAKSDWSPEDSQILTRYQQAR